MKASACHGVVRFQFEAKRRAASFVVLSCQYYLTLLNDDFTDGRLTESTCSPKKSDLLQLSWLTITCFSTPQTTQCCQMRNQETPEREKQVKVKQPVACKAASYNICLSLSTWFIHARICLFICIFIHVFIYSFIYILVLLFIWLFNIHNDETKPASCQLSFKLRLRPHPGPSPLLKWFPSSPISRKMIRNWSFGWVESIMRHDPCDVSKKGNASQREALDKFLLDAFLGISQKNRRLFPPNQYFHTLTIFNHKCLKFLCKYLEKKSLENT